jgi:hypothetical protein
MKSELFDKNDAQRQPKKPYTAPQMTVYGNLEEITMGCTGGRRESRFVSTRIRKADPDDICAGFS